MIQKNYLVIGGIAIFTMIALVVMLNVIDPGYSRDSLIESLFGGQGAGKITSASYTVSPYAQRTFEVRMLVDDMNHGEIERLFYLHLPENYSSAQDYPLLFILHGTSGAAVKMHEKSGFTQQSDQNNFIVVYPQALGYSFSANLDFRIPAIDPGYKTTGWNTTRGDGYGTANNIDDITFFRTMVEQITAILSINESRIYVTGFSNGGGMTQKLIAELPGYFNGGGLVSTAVPSASQEPENYVPIPLVYIHGTADTTTPYMGTDETLSAPEIADLFAEFNNCTGSNSENKTVQGFDVIIKTYEGCDAPVVFYTIIGGTHVWYNLESKTIWNFFDSAY